jgi:hypothetical protein
MSEPTSEEQRGGDDHREDDDQQSSGESFEGSDDPQVISDDQLPEDLRATDDNPLAKPEGEDDDSSGGVNLQEQAGDAGGPPS